MRSFWQSKLFPRFRARTICLGLAVTALGFPSPSNAADIFFSLEGPSPGGQRVLGESRQARRENWIEVSGAFGTVMNTLNLGSASGGAGAGRAVFVPLLIDKNVERSSPVLIHASVHGITYARGTLDVLRPPPSGDVFFRLRLKEVSVKSVDQHVNNEHATELLSLNFSAAEWTYWGLSKTGEEIQSHWDVTKNEGGMGPAPWAPGQTAPAGPVISALGDQTVAYGKSRTLTFQVSDADTPVNNLTFTRESSNPSLIPLDNIVISGSGGERTLTLTPLAGRSGASTIKIRVSDGPRFAERSFVFTVNPNVAPTLSAIANQTINENSTVSLEVTVGDTESAAGALTLKGTSSNLPLLPISGITFSGSGAARIVHLTPSAGISGNAEVTITVSDGELERDRTFTLKVLQTPGRRPADVTIEPALVQENSPAGTVVGALLTSDPDTDDAFTYELIANPSASFSLAGNEVRVAAGATIDFEKEEVFEIQVRVTDSDGLTLVKKLSIAVVNVNEAPILNDTVSVKTGKNAAASITGLEISDPDAGAGTVQASFRVEEGALGIRTDVAGGVTASQVQLSEPFALLTVTASLDQLNKTLKAPGGLTFTPNVDFVGSDSLTVVVNDLGNSGAGAPQQSERSFFIDVFPRTIDAWRNKKFSANDLGNPNLDQSLWGHKADPDGDGRDNLLEYALDLDPSKKENKEEIVKNDVVINEETGDSHLQVSFKRRRDDATLEYIPEIKGPDGQWGPGHGKIDFVKTETDSPETETVTYQFREPVQPGKPHIYRFKVRLNE